jgi:hypothetical protein
MPASSIGQAKGLQQHKEAMSTDLKPQEEIFK